MLSLKQCSRGHYYQGEVCPYCNTKSKPFDDIIDAPVGHTWDMNVCHNGYAYGEHLNCCPYCGEKEVFDHADMCSLWIGTLKIMLGYEASIKIDKHPECRMKTLEEGYLQHKYRTDYKIVGMPNFNYKSIILVNGREFTGKEFVNWVDFMIGVEVIENH